MRRVSRDPLRKFWGNPQYKDSEQSLKAWINEAKGAQWKNPSEVKAKYRHASIIPNNRVLLNIHGNTYRLIVAIKYPKGIVYIRFIGTHKQYNSIDAVNI